MYSEASAELQQLAKPVFEWLKAHSVPYVQVIIDSALAKTKESSTGYGGK